MKEKLKKHLTTILILSIIVFYFLLTYIVGAGLTQNPNVQLADFVVSEDGSKITLKIATTSPSESVRDYISLEPGDAQYLDFYYTFGVSNFTFGAKDEFVIEVDENCNGIFFLRDNGYELVLYRNQETNQWEIPRIETE